MISDGDGLVYLSFIEEIRRGKRTKPLMDDLEGVREDALEGVF